MEAARGVGGASRDHWQQMVIGSVPCTTPIGSPPPHWPFITVANLGFSDPVMPRSIETSVQLAPTTVLVPVQSFSSNAV
jgi:hypothetical protein